MTIADWKPCPRRSRRYPPCFIITCLNPSLSILDALKTVVFIVFPSEKIMSWKDHLKKLKAEWDNLTGEPHAQAPQQQQHQYPQQQYQQQQQQQHDPSQPPPVPPHPPVSTGHIYWQPRFQPGIPVTADWDAKLGNGPDGWGNQELEHYTANQENAF